MIFGLEYCFSFGIKHLVKYRMVLKHPVHNDESYSIRIFPFDPPFDVVLLWFQNVSCRSVSVGFAAKTSVFGSV